MANVDDGLLVLGGSGDDEDARLEVLPAVGGRIHRLRVFGRDLIRHPDDLRLHGTEGFYWGSYPLVPWCNRIPGGVFELDGRHAHLPATFPGGHAIHGLLHDVPWTVVADGEMEALGGGTDEYPWPFRGRQRFAADGSTVTQTLAVDNTGTTPMPAGLGIHPWFLAAEGLEVSVPATQTYDAEAEVPLPGPARPVRDGDDEDLRPLRQPAWGLDAVWTGLTENVIRLRWSTWGVEADYCFSDTADHVVFASFEEYGAFAIEPQTHTTDGHRRLAAGEPGAVAVVAPGESLEVTYEWRMRRT